MFSPVSKKKNDNYFLVSIYHTPDTILNVLLFSNKTVYWDVDMLKSNWWLWIHIGSFLHWLVPGENGMNNEI